MAVIPYPSLSPSGWVKEIREKLDRCFAVIFYSDFSQSNSSLGQVTSIPKIVQLYGNNSEDLKAHFLADIQSYLERYFELVSVNCSVVQPENKEDNRMEIIMDAVVTENGLKYDVSKTLQLADGKVVGIIDRARV